jgi:hypothetical protein
LNISEEGPDKSEIILGVWDDFKCWKCNEKTRVIEWSWRSGEGEMWTENDQIGLTLGQRFPSYKKDYTKTADAYYYCNHCTSCGAIQGDWFVVNWVAQERAAGRLPSDVVNLKIDPDHPLSSSSS